MSKRTTIAAVIGVGIVLAGCGESGGQFEPANGGDTAPATEQSNDAHFIVVNGVPCIVYDNTRGAAISCDWEGQQ